MAAPTPTPRLATTPLRARPDGIAEPPTRSSMPLDRSSPIATRPVGFAGAESMGGAPAGVERAVEVAGGWVLPTRGRGGGRPARHRQRRRARVRILSAVDGLFNRRGSRRGVGAGRLNYNLVAFADA